MAAKLPITPVGANILVKPTKEDTTTTPSGLVISSSSKDERPQIGEIMALGSGKIDEYGKKVPWNVKVGQKIAFKKYSPDKFEFEEEEFLIMKEEDVLGIIN